MKDQQIIEEIANGNIRVENEVYIQYRTQFLLFARKNYRNSLREEKIEDVYQDAYIAFCQNVKCGKLKIITSLKSYIFEIGKHLLVKEVDKGRRTIGLSDHHIEESSLFEGDEPHEVKERMIDIAINSIKELSAECARLLNLFYFEKKKYEDYYQELGYNSADVAKAMKYKCFLKLQVVAKKRMQEAQLI